MLPEKQNNWLVIEVIRNVPIHLNLATGKFIYNFGGKLYQFTDLGECRDHMRSTIAENARRACYLEIKTGHIALVHCFVWKEYGKRGLEVKSDGDHLYNGQALYYPEIEPLITPFINVVNSEYAAYQRAVFALHKKLEDFMNLTERDFQ